MRKFIWLLLLPSLFISCVTQTEHEKIIQEKDEIARQMDTLKAELEEIKFGAPNLLVEGKRLYDSKNFSMARQKFQMLIEKHNEMPQSIEAQKYLSIIDEEDLYNSAVSSQDIAKYESYLNSYPKGKYAGSIKSGMKDLRTLAMENDYADAVSRNTSAVWKEFLNQYPEHPEASIIKKRIIKLEVEEIIANTETRQMPQFNQIDYGHSSNSTVEITNSTGCELTVRYSGSDVKMIVIPVGDKRSVNMSSGEYKIAASACGENYAGTENLHGDYNSRFYITISRY